MAIVYIPDHILEKLESGDITFDNIDGYDLVFSKVEATDIACKKQKIPEELRWEVFERDDFRCRECGCRRMLQADHIIPESKGGATVLENLQTLCKRHNVKKGNKI